MAAIVSVAEQATLLAARRTAQWVEAGASAVNVLAPTIVAPDADATAAHLGAVLKAVAPAPVIVQYAPALPGSPMRLDQVRRLAGEHANLAAVKVETLPAGPTITALAEGSPALGSLVGYGGLHLIDALRRGAAGVQPGSSFTEVYQRIWRLWRDGDEPAAEALHTRLLPYLAYWMQDVQLIVRAEKVIAHHRGLIQSDHCRSPAPPRPARACGRRAISRRLPRCVAPTAPGVRRRSAATAGRRTVRPERRLCLLTADQACRPRVRPTGAAPSPGSGTALPGRPPGGRPACSRGKPGDATIRRLPPSCRSDLGSWHPLLSTQGTFSRKLRRVGQAIQVLTWCLAGLAWRRSEPTGKSPTVNGRAAESRTQSSSEHRIIEGYSWSRRPRCRRDA